MDSEYLDDLAQYKKFKNKNVTEAAKSIINLFREINPKMLKRRYKIRPTEAVKELNEKSFEYGALNAKSYIPGTEVLPINPSTTIAADDKIVEDEKANDSDGWIDVSHSEDEVYFDEEEENEDEKEESGVEKEESGVEKEESGVEKEESEVEKEESGVEKEESGVEKEESGVEKEESGVEKEESGVEKEESEDKKEESEDKKEENEDKKEENEDEKKENEDESAKPVESSTDKIDAADPEKSKEKEETLTAEEIKTIKAKAETISQSRILSQAEFVRIKAAQLTKQVTYAKGKKRTAVILKEPVIDNPEIVSLKDIERLAKKPKATKEERIASIMEGREDREKFGKKKKKSEYASKTQKQHNKNKAFMMIKHKVKSKVKRSFRDKQLALKRSMLKQKKRKH
ncbi:protein SDA1 homolog [Trichonephila clavata]|uniref:Protein SDA1 n=1 Tax=Trichonephila clavata TaxID=2740835 RepID=A0A8X6G5V3_TRICU|nr:protein SDA1 homolog [Trichonephila clavata]